MVGMQLLAKKEDINQAGQSINANDAILQKDRSV
jgi:hypothetical protein